MNMRRTLAFTRRMLKQFRHDRRTFVFVMLMPLLMMLLFGYTFGGEPKDLDVAVVNLDRGYSIPGHGNLSLSRMILDNLDEETYVLESGRELAAALDDLEEGRVWAVLYFPANFSENLALNFLYADNESASIGLFLDDSNPNIVSAVVNGLRDSIQKTKEDMLGLFNRSSENENMVVEYSYEYAGGGEIEFIDYFAPGIIAFAIMMVTTMLTIILFVNERRNGTLDRLLASPAGEGEIVAGYAMAFAVIGILQSMVILTAAMLVFDITIAGSVLLALFVVMLLAFGHQGLGILLSSLAKNEMQAVQFVPLIIFPSVLLAGLFWPIQSIPRYLRPISYVIPLRYGIDAERAIMIKGWGLGQVWVQIAVLIFFALLTLTGSVLLLKKRR